MDETLTTSTMPAGVSTVDRETWTRHRDRLAGLEQAEAEARDAATAARREIPAVRVETDYAFERGGERLALADLFLGRAQLVLYHFMFAPEWTEGCPHCTQFAEGIAPGVVRGLADAGTTLALVSRASSDRLDAWREQHGWDIPWFSMDDEFARDFGSLVDDGDRPALNVLVRDGDSVLHTFQGRGREMELVIPAQRWLDFTPRGGATFA